MASMSLNEAYSVFDRMSGRVDHRLIDIVTKQGMAGATVTSNYNRDDLYKARDMLTEMMDKEVANYELETVRCEELEMKQLTMLRESKQDIDYVNAQAASARSISLKAEESINAQEETKLPRKEQQLEQIGEKCESELTVLKEQLTLANSDVSTLDTIFEYFTCSEATAATAATVASVVTAAPTSNNFMNSISFAALRGSSNSSGRKADYAEEDGDGSLVQCACLDGGKPVVRVRHSQMQANLRKLKSQMAQQAVQDYLREAFAESERQRPSQTQGAVLAQARVASKAGAVTGEPVFEACRESENCTITPADCPRLRDGFMVIYGTIHDKRDELTEDISSSEKACEQAKEDISVAISTETGKLQASQGDLAAATKLVVENQQQMSQASTSYADLLKDYKSQMKECCDNKNSYMSQLCGLRKIRGELLKKQVPPEIVKDCAVSDWTDGECSASCDGGTQERTRTVIEFRVNGTKCPPEKMVRQCKLQKCPIDCQAGVWSEWTECTAECGGGVRTRSRPKTVEPKYDGQPCPELSDTQQCNAQACNADCELGDWEDWSACSKACNTGHRERRMPVKVLQRGTGKCVGVDSEQRLGFEECNNLACTELLPANRSVLECSSKMDVVLLLDGSASLRDGFIKSKDMVAKLLTSLVGGEDTVKAAILLYGGPTTPAGMAKCNSGNPADPPDLQNDCGMQWVSRFTNDTAALSQQEAQLVDPMSTTMTSMALAEARAELENGGRAGADSVVVAVTDARPISARKTAKAAEDLKKSARLIWIAVGPETATAMDHLKVWATKPWQDNLVEIKDINLLSTPKMLNSIIASMCPIVK